MSTTVTTNKPAAPAAATSSSSVDTQHDDKKTINAKSSNKMKSALVHDFFPKIEQQDNDKIKQLITISDEADRPQLDPKKSKKEMIVRVLACSLSPGDTMMLRGNAIFMKPSKFPYTPGMDIVGVVEEVSTDVSIDGDFKVGDTVVATNGLDPVGGMAQYMKISTDNAVLKPTNVPILEAAACSSAVTSLNAVFDYVKKGERVLILGGSGGVGSSAITIAKKVIGASFVATTSTQLSMCKNLGADAVINYKERNWWEMREYQDEETKFDTIIDTVGGGNFTNKAMNVLKTGANGGKFIAVTGDDPIPDATTWWKAIKFFANLPIRPLYTRIFSKSYRTYVLIFPHDENKARRDVLQLMDEGILQIYLDPSSPLPFTDDGVQKAFKVVGSGHAHGKVVVQIEG